MYELLTTKAEVFASANACIDLVDKHGLKSEKSSKGTGKTEGKKQGAADPPTGLQ